MTTAAVLSLIALIIFIANIVMSLVNLAADDSVIPQGFIWGTWFVGAVLLVLSFVA